MFRSIRSGIRTRVSSRAPVAENTRILRKCGRWLAHSRGCPGRQALCWEWTSEGTWLGSKATTRASRRNLEGVLMAHASPSPILTLDSPRSVTRGDSALLPADAAGIHDAAHALVTSLGLVAKELLRLRIANRRRDFRRQSRAHEGGKRFEPGRGFPSHHLCAFRNLHQPPEWLMSDFRGKTASDD
jgi:hypothetical protein